jgi:TetR/AcrR family transcriptional regulator, cholesterol catabolism regulator
MTTISLQTNDWLERVEKLFLRFGIKSITMDDVAADLGISKKTLYQWVESKDALVVKVLEHHIACKKMQCLNLSSLAPNALEEIFVILESNNEEMAQMKTNIVNDLQKYHRQGLELIQKFRFDYVFKVIRENLIRGRQEGLYREDFDIDILAKLHFATAMNLFDPDLFPDGPKERVVVFKEYMLHYLHGIVSPKGLTYLKKKLS